MLNQCTHLRVASSSCWSIEHEVCRHADARLPAHDASGKGVGDGGDIESALPSGHIGEVHHPQLIGAFSMEVALHAIEQARMVGIGQRGTLPACHGVRLAGQVVASSAAPPCSEPLRSPRAAAGARACARLRLASSR